MSQYLRYFFLFVCVFSFKSSNAVISYTDSNQRIALAKELLLFTPDRETDIDEVRRVDSFRLLKSGKINLGLQKYSVWLKFTLENNSSYNHLILKIDYPLLDDVEFFFPVSKDSFQSVSSGLKVPFSRKGFKMPSPAFDLGLSPGESKTYYLRVKSPQQIILPIVIADPYTFIQETSKHFIFSALFLGAVIIMIIYHSFLFLVVRDFNYIYFVIFIFFFELTQIGIDGFTFQYFWPENTLIASKSTHVFACISGIFALLLINKFLKIKQYAPLAYKGVVALIVLFILALSLGILGFNRWGFILMQFTTAIGSLVSLGISFYIFKKGYTPAKVVFYSWLIFLMGALIFLLKDYNVLPYNTFTKYSVQLGAFIQISLLSFGLAYRINIIKNERDESRLSALKEAYRSEQIIKKQNFILEKKVKERTMELRHSNEYLETSLSSLKEAQSHLVFAEKMSSLGQLTAGIAHEINNPINFVASNILPLERDIDILVETMEMIEKIHAEPITLEEKQKAITKLKEDNDLEYTIEELNSLIKGIKDGANRTATIVRSLRTFSRIDQSESNNVNLNEGLEATIIIAKNELHNIELKIDLADLPKIYCSSGKLNQVFLNLITNAAFAIKDKFKGEMGGVLSIQTKFNDQYVLIIIQDNGIGMSQETKEKIFNPFYTTKDVGEGTGLGMSISSSILDQHNGQILVESEEGIGTCITLQIPNS